MKSSHIRLENEDHDERSGREGEHPVGVDEPVASREERLGGVFVLGEDRRQEGEPVERRVRGEEQDHRGRCLEDEEHDCAVAEDGDS